MLLIIYLLIFAKFCTSARILGFFPTPSISHQIVFRTLIDELVSRKHDVVFATTDPVDYADPPENLLQINTHDVSYPVWNALKLTNVRSMRLMHFQNLLYDTIIDITDKQLKSPQIQKLINDPQEHFDICIIEAWVYVGHAFKRRFGCSLVLMSSLSPDTTMYDSIGNTVNPAIDPVFFAILNENDSFWKRLMNVIYEIEFKFNTYYNILPRINALERRYFKNNTNEEVSPDLILTTMHPIFEGIKPLLPIVVHMSGIHIKPNKPLPQKIQSILDDSDGGVIYFSLGTNVQSADLSSKTRQAFIEAFAGLPYTVLWKFENGSLGEKPANVHHFKWMPQQDVLAHPNIKAFITQGGYQSTEEAIYHRVPMVAVPFYSDQFHNAYKIQKLGIGIHLNLNELTSVLIKEAIQQVVNDNRYKKNIEALSIAMQDQPQSGLERAMWWIDYILRHNGTSFIQSSTKDIPLYQVYLLDVICLAFICVLLLFYASLRVFKYMSERLHLRFNKLKVA